jgi:hypothetical protein
LLEELDIKEKYLVFKEVSEGLADTQSEKLLELSESIKDVPADQYQEKLETLKESFISGKNSSDKTVTEETENVIVEDKLEQDHKIPEGLRRALLYKRNNR